jgi:hypothetical protein
MGRRTEAQANWVVDSMASLMRSTGTQPKKFKVRFGHSDIMCNCARLTAISQNQTNVILKIASVLPRGSDTRVKIKSCCTKIKSCCIKGCILGDPIKKEFIIKG